MVGLAKQLISGNNDELKLHRLLGTLFKSDITPNEKKDILSKEFEISMTEEMERSVESMCNLSEAIAEENREKGIKIGREEGMEKLIASFLRKDNRISQAILMLDVSEGQVRSIVKKYGISIEM